MTGDQKTELSGGGPVTADHREIDPKTGMQKGYVVLSAEERAKGYVRPVRRTYRHVGPRGPQYPLRDLTGEEQTKYGIPFGYVKFEPYPKAESPLTGRFWTQAQLDAVAKGGCGFTTKMARDLAETYAREPKFYNGTFCVRCRAHFDVGEFVWEGTDERVGS